jgi:hypothetical protein
LQSPVKRGRVLGGLIVLQILPWEQLFGKTEVAHVKNAHWIKYARQMIAFVLHYARMEIIHSAIYDLTVLIETTVTQAAVTRHQTAHAWHAQASLPALFHFISNRC